MFLVSAVIIVVLVVAGYYNTELNKTNDLLVRVDPDMSCDLHQQACRVKIPGSGEVTLSIKPRPIPLVQELTIDVTTQAINAEKIAINFTGINMQMGPNNVSLRAQEDGTFTGEGMLPVCTQRTMQWQAEVYIQTDDGMVIVPYQFATNTNRKY